MPRSKTPGFKKNWRAIAGITNQHLRVLMIHCGGWIFTALLESPKLRRYFLFEDEEQAKLNEHELLLIAKDAEHMDTLVKVLRDLGIQPYTRKFYPRHHHCIGSVSGVPEELADGAYRFSMSAFGARISHEGTSWLVIWKDHPGINGDKPHRFCMVKVSDLAKG